MWTDLKRVTRLTLSISRSSWKGILWGLDKDSGRIFEIFLIEGTSSLERRQIYILVEGCCRLLE